MNYFNHVFTLQLTKRTVGLPFVIALAALMAQSDGISASTFVVSNALDSGAGSLRQAINSANANPPGTNAIIFSIPGTGPFTITLGSTLPTIIYPVTIDGTSQPGYAGKPLIELNCAGVGGLGFGLQISAGGCTVKGLVVNRAPVHGIFLEGAGGGNVIQANFIGTDPTGKIARPNGQAGVLIYQSVGNLIGGTNAADRNLISGNGAANVYIWQPGASNNVVQGNYIGTDVTGSTALGNTNSGITLFAPGNTVGGDIPGAGNLISGNGQSGIFIQSGTARSVIQGNLIGTDPTGMLAVPNKGDGITIAGGVNNTVGGTTALARNIISGNLAQGVDITPGTTNTMTSNLVIGNYIGTDITGSNSLGNRTNGVLILGVSGNTIGGNSGSAANLISGNKSYGVLIAAAGTSNNLVAGNLIGTAVTGFAAISNTLAGVGISGSSWNTIGGTGAGFRNIISGNGTDGVIILGGGISNVVAGNFIGVVSDGYLPLGNGQAGVRIEGARAIVGGTAPGAGNLISGNTNSGIFIYGTTASNNVVQGNFIGTDADGRYNIGNLYQGVAISNAAGNLIGGTVPGARNLISGNWDGPGIILLGSKTTGNVIQGNYIGPDITGTHAIVNLGGIYIEGAPTNLIGGTIPGAGNLISANNDEGINCGTVAGANGNVIQGNFIGTQIDGVSPLPNLYHNIDFNSGASGNIVGGSTRAADNRIAYANPDGYDGIRVRSGSVGNLILGNSIFQNGASSTDGLGICVGPTGQTTNAATLTSALTDGTLTTVQGVLHNPNGTYLLQFYANDITNVSGFGEGLTCLGSTSVTISSGGHASFSATLSNGAFPGQFISATTTDAANNTSEFSANIPVTPPPSLSFLSSGFTRVVTSSANGTPITNFVPRIDGLAWPAGQSGFSLMQATNLTPPIIWTVATNLITLSGGLYQAPFTPASKGNIFYGLRLP